jgi:hypothetical protein
LHQEDKYLSATAASCQSVGNAVTRAVAIRSFVSLLYRFPESRRRWRLLLELDHVVLRVTHEDGILAGSNLAEALPEDICRVHWMYRRNRL